jgi:hypothetical protein
MAMLIPLPPDPLKTGPAGPAAPLEAQEKSAVIKTTAAQTGMFFLFFISVLLMRECPGLKGINIEAFSKLQFLGKLYSNNGFTYSNQI